MSNLAVAAVADTTVDTRPIPPAEAWFAGGERVGYDPGAGATIAAQDAPLKVFVRREGDMAHTVTFLPGFPDGSFGWTKVRPHWPHAAEMPKLFFDYAGMGDSDKPKDYAYSTAERTDLVEAIWRDLSIQPTTLAAFDVSSLAVLEHLRRRRAVSAAKSVPAGGIAACVLGRRGDPAWLPPLLLRHARSRAAGIPGSQAIWLSGRPLVAKSPTGSCLNSSGY